MFQNISRALLCIGTVLVFNNVHAGWYLDISYSANETNLSNERSELPGYGPIQVDNSSSGFQITSGYEVNSYVDIELSYVDFGKFNAEVSDCPLNSVSDPYNVFDDNGCFIGATITPFPGFGDSDLTPVLAPIIISRGPLDLTNRFTPGSSIDVRAKGLRLAIASKIPAGQRFSFYLQGGMLVPEYKVTTTTLVPVLDRCCVVTVPMQYDIHKETKKSHDPELFLGLGLSWNITSSISTKLFWENYFDFGEGEYLEQDLDSYNLSLRYHF